MKEQTELLLQRNSTWDLFTSIAVDKINKSKDLKTKLEMVIEKTNKQKKVLKKILTQLNKQNGDLDDQSSISEKK